MLFLELWGSALPCSLIATALLRPSCRRTLLNNYRLLRIEYDAMLYGNQGVLVDNSTEPHFTLATQGALFGKGSGYLLTPQGCMRREKSSCLPPTHPYTPYITNGAWPAFLAPVLLAS